jgi:hypothetical protein
MSKQLWVLAMSAGIGAVLGHDACGQSMSASFQEQTLGNAMGSLRWAQQATI